MNLDVLVDPNSRREILRVDQPQFNHDASSLLFDDAGLLYVPLGDGGTADDQGPGHSRPSFVRREAHHVGRISPLGQRVLA